jgi:hypothetical protein
MRITTSNGPGPLGKNSAPSSGCWNAAVDDPFDIGADISTDPP